MPRRHTFDLPAACVPLLRLIQALHSRRLIVTVFHLPTFTLLVVRISATPEPQSNLRTATQRLSVHWSLYRPSGTISSPTNTLFNYRALSTSHWSRHSVVNGEQQVRAYKWPWHHHTSTAEASFCVKPSIRTSSKVTISTRFTSQYVPDHFQNLIKFSVIHNFLLILQISRKSSHNFWVVLLTKQARNETNKRRWKNTSAKLWRR